MAFRVNGSWYRVGELIALFTAMGCELHELNRQVDNADFGRLVRFLYNPENECFVSLSDLADDELLPPSEVENWERRLDISIPKGESHH